MLVLTPLYSAIARLLVVAVFAVLAGISGWTATPAITADADDVRALWVTRAALATPEAVVRMVQSARAARFNTLLVQVRGRGDAYYRSTLEPRATELARHPDFDPLGLAIERAHAAGLRVHAWVAVNLVSSAATLPASRDHLVYKNPEWLMVPRALAVELRRVDARSPEYVGRLARWSRAHSDEVEGLYASPVHPAAATHITEVVRELATRYALDGIHLDYVRFPGEEFDYGRATIDAFVREVRDDLTASQRQAATRRETVDALAYPNMLPERWDAFRRSRLTALVMRIRTAVKAARPSIALSAAVIPDAREAYQSRLQDWRTWLDQSLLDVLCPMAYTQEPRLFEEQVALARDYAAGRPVWAGIGAYRLSAPDTLRFIGASRRLGVSGVILFSYDALVAPPNTASTLTELGRAAFGGGSD